MKKYIFASSKPWHDNIFMDLKGRYGEWFFVKNPKEMLEVANAINPDFIFFLHWSWIVPASIVNKFSCVCFHMTDVPYGRGGSPLQNLILSGKKETKLTALKMSEGLDDGPVYLKRELSLTGRAEEIYNRAGELSKEMLEEIISKKIYPVPQEGEAIIFKRRNPEQSEIPVNLGIENFYDYIRMLDAPTYPHAFLTYGNMIVEFSDVEFDNGKIIAKAVIKENKGNLK